MVLNISESFLYGGLPLIFLQFFFFFLRMSCRGLVEDFHISTQVYTIAFGNFSLRNKHLLFKVDNRNIRKMCEICSKVTVTAPESRRQGSRFGVFFIPFEHISYLFLTFYYRLSAGKCLRYSWSCLF